MPALGRLVLIVFVAAILFVAFVMYLTATAHAGGIASFYGREHQGGPVACGGRFNMYAMTAAHRTLPCGTRVRVTHGRRSIVVTITDRGPWIRGRIIDLSDAARRAIGMGGTAYVELQVIK